MRSALSFVILMAACGGSPARPPMGVHDHLVAANRSDASAAHHDEIADEVEQAQGTPQPCPDGMVAPAPCWAGEPDVAEEHRAEAERLRSVADEHRELAKQLLAAEHESCAEMAAADLSHSPFAHRADIAAVTAVLEGSSVRGAEIRFRPVKHLTAEWMRVAIGCHQARAAVLGTEVAYMPYDPTTVVGAEVSIVDEPDGIIVIVRAKDDEVAKTIYARAADLLDTDATTARR